LILGIFISNEELISMYRPLLLIGILFFTTASSPANASAPPSSKRVVYCEVFPVVPGTLEEMFEASDEVIEVQILSSVAKSVGDPGNPHVRTFYTAKVLRIRKGTPHGQVVFTQAVGEVEFPDHILRTEGEALTTGQRYVVFLRRDDYFGGRMLVGERDGAFKIRNGHIEPQGFGKLADEQRNLTERSFGDELDRLSKRSMSKDKENR
jgi:hypothetical protein